MLPSATPPDAAARIDTLARLARARRMAEAEARASQVGAVAAAGRRWLDAHVAEVRGALEERVTALARVGTAPSLFTLMGLSGYEKPYNRVLAWIADPTAGHGAGRAVLRALGRRLDAAGLLADLDDPDAVIEVRGELAWPADAGSTQQPDLVVLSPSFALLVENKVNAGESGPSQYADYLDALLTLATARGIAWAAWLAAPAARSLPAAARDDATWTGTVSHADLARAIRAAASAPEVSVWGRVACLLVAAQLEVPDGQRNALDEARSLLARADTAPDVVAMRGVLARLPEPAPPWEMP
jgi:hypothetical protein